MTRIVGIGASAGGLAALEQIPGARSAAKAAWPTSWCNIRPYAQRLGLAELLQTRCGHSGARGDTACPSSRPCVCDPQTRNSAQRRHTSLKSPPSRGSALADQCAFFPLWRAIKAIGPLPSCCPAWDPTACWVCRRWARSVFVGRSRTCLRAIDSMPPAAPLPGGGHCRAPGRPPGAHFGLHQTGGGEHPISRAHQRHRRAGHGSLAPIFLHLYGANVHGVSPVEVQENAGAGIRVRSCGAADGALEIGCIPPPV